MRTLSVLFGVVALIALIVVCVSESRTRHELAELRAAAKKAADSPQSSASPPALPPSIATDLHALTARMLSGVAIAAQTSRHAPETPSAVHHEDHPMTLAQEQEQVRLAYAKESFDPTWRRDAEKKLDVAVRASLPPGSRLLSLECRTPMCMLEISHADASVAHGQGQRWWISSVAQGWDGSLFVAGEREEHGEIVQTLIPMKGDKLPIDTSL
jgi:hypothetical protein